MVRGWIALGMLTLGVGALFLYRGSTSATPLHATAYYEGNPDINTDAAVLFHKEVVGGIEAIQAGLPCVQLILRRNGDRDWLEAATIERDSLLRIGDSATGLFLARFTGDTLTLTTQATNRTALAFVHDVDHECWWLAPMDSSLHVELNRHSMDNRYAKVTSADEIRIGTELIVRWNEPGIYSRVCLYLDIGRIRTLANGRTIPVRTIVATLSTGFALARPGIRLTLPPVASQAQPLNPSETSELMPEQDIDLYAVLNQVGGYLTDRRKMFAPPHNRAERIVNDINNGLTHADTLIATLDTTSLHLKAITADLSITRGQPKTLAGKTIDNIRTVAGDARTTLARITHVVDSLKATIATVNKATLPKVNAAVDDLADAADNLNIALQDLSRLSERLRTSTMPKAEAALDQLGPELRQTLQRVRTALHSLQNAGEAIRDGLP